MRRLFLILALTLGACASTSPYTGPTCTLPYVRTETRRYPSFAGGWGLGWHSQPIVIVANPSRRKIRFTLDCLQSEWRDRELAAMTEETFLLGYPDASCKFEFRMLP
jgi:hypothetical protein